MKFKRALATKTDINMVPMIDVVFQLIIFFMVATTLIVTPGIPITLPNAATSEEVTMNRLVITVKSSTELYLNQERLSGLADLDRALRGRPAAAPVDAPDQAERDIVIEGDQTVSYALIVDIIDVIRQNGFKAANLRTNQAAGGR